MRAAFQLESELNSGMVAAHASIPWGDFRKRYENEVLPGLARNTAIAYGTAMNHFENIVGIVRLDRITESILSDFAKGLRDQGKSEHSIKSYLTGVSAFLSWAKKMRLIPRVPEIPRIVRAKSQRVMKGRPLTAREMGTLLKATASVVGKNSSASWKRLLKGLWWSGLRLGESLNLYWDRRDKLCIDMTGKHPMLLVRAELEKGKQDRVLPLAPEFCTMLEKTPLILRTGPVFDLGSIEVKAGWQRSAVESRSVDWVSRIIRRIGKKAGIMVDKNKYASAHDLRRSFGSRWARLVRPAVLMQLMRHENIQTTMRFYVELDSERTADELWKSVGMGGEVKDCSVSCSVKGNESQ